MNWSVPLKSIANLFPGSIAIPLRSCVRLLIECGLTWSRAQTSAERTRLLAISQLSNALNLQPVE